MSRLQHRTLKSSITEETQVLLFVCDVDYSHGLRVSRSEFSHMLALKYILEVKNNVGQFYFQICIWWRNQLCPWLYVSDVHVLSPCKLLVEALYGQCPSQAQQSREQHDSGELTGFVTLLCVLSCLVLSCPVTYHVTWQRCRIWATKAGIFFFFCIYLSGSSITSRLANKTDNTLS